MSLFSLFSTKPKSLGQIQNSSGGTVTASVIMSSGSAIAKKQLLLWEIGEGGGENTLFLILTEAYRKNPTIDGMGLLMSTFVAESGDMQINIDKHVRAKVQNAIKTFYSTRRQGVTTMQFRNQRPPSNVFDEAVKAVSVDVGDVLARFSVGGGMSVSGTTVSFHNFEVTQDSGRIAGRILKLQEIRMIASAALKMGLNPPQFLLNLSY
jgi:hypothetical protein